MIIATLDTTNFQFTALGEDKVKAFEALERGWEVHRTQYAHKPLLDLRVFEDEIIYIDIDAGDCVRDYGCKL